MFELIKAYESGSTLNFTELKKKVSKKRKLKGVPRVVDVLSAIPETYRKHLTPFLKSKPVRGASGVAVVAVMSKPVSDDDDDDDDNDLAINSFPSGCLPFVP